MDNASVDETRDVVSSFEDPRIRYVRNVKDLGMTGNFNRILNLSRGDYVTCLCDDDWIEPEFVEACVTLFAEFPALGLVACPAIARDNEGREVWRYALRGDRYISSHSMWHRMVRRQNEIGSPSSVMLSRAAIEATGVFDASFPWLADWDYWIRVFSVFPIGYVPRHLANIRQHAGSASVSNWQSTVPLQVALGTVKKAFRSDACVLSRFERWCCAGRGARGFVGDCVKAAVLLKTRRSVEVARGMARYFSLPGLFCYFVLTFPAYVAHGMWRRVRMWRKGPFVMPEMYPVFGTKE